ncbi:MAG TPA: ABC transporter ATP-binding protein [Lachnospiraceae bacterium]|nr:ABC transporter ATP-binding protein [Lachnospiraceae bacterium]
MKNILEVDKLTKSFRRKVIVDEVSFAVEEGQVMGFVGPNGAGKSTTLKMITNILIPDSGSIRIAGYDILKDREKALQYVSGIIESPALYEELSGYDNLHFIRKMLKKSRSDYDQVVEIIGLSSAMRKKVARYSLGMKQRLALGMALLAQPKFLILDEPTNGLDATGTIELRNLIRKLADEGTSILLSSHQLSEVEKMADAVTFIKEGRIVQNKQKVIETKRYHIETGNKAHLLLELEPFKDIITIDQNEEEYVEISLREEDFSRIMRSILSDENRIKDIIRVNTDLEYTYQNIFCGDGV